MSKNIRMTKAEKEKGYIYISQVVSPETHKQMQALCSNRKITMKGLVQILCNWAGEHSDDPVYLIRCGVNLPLWASDRAALSPLSEGSNCSCD